MKFYSPTLLIALLLLTTCTKTSNETNTPKSTELYKGPIIDMHIHSIEENELSPDSMAMCLPLSTIVEHYDPKDEYGDIFWGNFSNPDCENPIWSPTTYDAYIERLKGQIDKYQLNAIVNGAIPTNQKLIDYFPDKLQHALQFRINRDSISVDSIKTLLQKFDIKVLSEITNQYGGIAPNDPRMFPYYELAQELDIPVGIHMGSGLPGTPLFLYPDYRVEFSNPLLLEDVLKKFPKLRIAVMHYGEPFIDEMIAMMVSYPQLYVEIGGIMWAYPKEYFYEYHLKKLVLAGFGKRILFGSDMIIWPELIGESISIINEAPFLSYEQKADIFYNNAVRFLRLNSIDN
ncbi:amidohydrolase family protein [Chondrinema litorale]|uniref:amidohydrolase family protein n=1 Tax=Chondrinema litorale TaxID=2994555 RepID=UPI002543DACC|nr:amidohydrolase family protein [Chondrinema litorale]UZR97222.1 amidohydrolase family protein [Chondrinema litorale]